MKAYYAAKISENMSVTPNEGFLICRNVPISRTGYQDYMGEELGLEEYRGQTIKVYRSPDEVFDPDSMSSFEGKPICNEHPSNGVNAENADLLVKGTMRDIRRGEEKTSDGEELLLADFIIYDKQLIDAVMNGKRDVSSGYVCEYAMNEKGIVEQKKIRGNHGAVVTAGRAGPEVSIQDSKPAIPKPKTERRHRFMKKHKDTIGEKLSRWSATIFSNDSSPEDKAEILGEMGEALLEAAVDEESAVTAAPTDNDPAVDSDPATDNQPTTDNQAVMDAIASLSDQMGKLADTVAAMQAGDNADPLAKLEAELSGDEDSTEDEDPTADDDPTQDEAPLGDEQPDMTTADNDPDEGQEPVGIQVNDRNVLLQQIRAVRPAIAQIKDKKAQRMVSDSLARAMRMSMGKPRKPAHDGYAAMLQVQNQAAGQYVHDSKPMDQGDMGRKIRDSRNPHYTKNK